MNKRTFAILDWVLAAFTAAPTLVLAQANTNPWPSSGSVGIGTTSPAYKLDVLNGQVRGLYLWAGGAGTGYDGRIYVTDSTGATRIYLDGYPGGANYINNGGSVGIGTSAPKQALTVAGIINSSAQSDYYGAWLSGSSAAGGESWLGLGPWYSQAGYVKWIDGGSPRRLSIYTADPAAAVTLQEAGGNVGIGTTAPSTAKLAVASPQTTGTNAVVAEFSRDGGTSSDGSAMLRVSRWFGGQSTDLELNSGSAGPFRFGTTYLDTLLVNNQNATNGPYGSIQFVTNNEIRLTIGGGTLAGNVGVGTTAPTEKLAVNGRIRAKEVIVETNWSDFVFDPGYRLTPLAEVERRIRAERHLPGIPSAQEVAQGGVSLGEMQARLLQKVEELTLYTIQLQKENETLRARVTALEAK